MTGDKLSPATRVRGWDLLGNTWLNRVLSTPEADLRAHMIALTYSKYALHLDDILHGDESVRRLANDRKRIATCNTNWFHYATWGTVTVTRNIAHQRAPQRLDDFLPTAVRSRLTPALIRERAASGQRVSRALAWGQRLIFITAAYSLQQFAAGMNGIHLETDEKFRLDETTKKTITDKSFYRPDRSNEALRSSIERSGVHASVDDQSDGRKTPIAEGRHLDPIERAFDFYRLASKETGDDAADARARLILGANVLLTAAEQDLAQAAVATVIDHVPQRFMNSVYRRTAKTAEMLTGVPRQIVGLQLPTKLLGLHDLVDTAWSRLMTDQVMVMTLPTETLRLGRDIPPRDPALPFYPQALRHFDRPRNGADPRSKALRKTGEMVQSFDRAGADGRGSAARDWRLFADRMNWAVALLRSRQQDETLFWPPYSTEDEDRIIRGRLPYRAGDPSELEVQAPSDYYVVDE